MQFTEIQGPIFVIKLKVTVGYDPIDDDCSYHLPGLFLNNTLVIDRNPETLNTSLREVLLNENLVPFQLDRCFWELSHDDDGFDSWRYEFLDDDEEKLCDRIFKFLCELNANHNILGVTLEIWKDVEVPSDEFWSWISYYREKKLVYSRGSISLEYGEAIKRPRSEIQLLEEEMSFMAFKSASRASVNELESVIYNSDIDGDEKSDAAAKSCSICLEEIVNGSRVTGLPCLHVFHGDCVVRWMRGNHVCPLCRYPLPTDDDDGDDEPTR
ncbi:hypothetical protein BUALT_Bualt13G0074300 [Buddleja alternifolia]|uniref:RING-type E3 ubiquitin transferase n=1 Tax=Buddleja alternifolia TaxID=168488 RepID=A0AAV6WKS4_9LAMI|nr:hypothetical protein BUALT_Bualt13G0074300 [Buddleja alternifolia]